MQQERETCKTQQKFLILLYCHQGITLEAIVNLNGSKTFYNFPYLTFFLVPRKDKSSQKRT